MATIVYNFHKTTIEFKMYKIGTKMNLGDSDLEPMEIVILSSNINKTILNSNLCFY